MGKPSTRRGDRLRAGHTDRARRKPPLDDGRYALSSGAKEMLRALRDRIDGEGVYTGSDADAAALAGVTVEAAGRALHGLASRGLVKLRRAPAARA